MTFVVGFRIYLYSEYLDSKEYSKSIQHMINSINDEIRISK